MLLTGKRIGYVGLSSPIFYDYQNRVEKVMSDVSSSPNPILDSPAGLLLGYDEIWFLCRSLCPQNMRNLNYIKFIEDTNLLINFKVLKSDLDSLVSECFSEEQIAHHSAAFSHYDKYLERVGVSWGKADNHSHSLKIKHLDGFELSANSMFPSRVLFDLAVVTHLGRGIELVTNSFTQRLLTPFRDIPKSKVTEKIIRLELDNYQSISGPYHPIYEEIRDNIYMTDFRKWISRQQDSFSNREADELERDVNNQLRLAKKNALLKELEGGSLTRSLSKIAIGKTVDFISPGLGFANKVLPGLKEEFLIENRRWQAFLVSLE